MIVADSTSLIHLSKIGKLEILRQVFNQIIIPEAVYNETVIKGQEKLIISANNIGSQKWIIKKNLNENQKLESKNLLKNANIDLGEAEAIILAKTDNLGLIIDDGVGIKVAESFGIETFWTTSIILKAVSKKILTKTEAKTIIENLVKTGLHIKPEILILILSKLS